MSHTPGPWIIDEGKRDGLLMVYADIGGMPGVIINQGRIVARDRANARLIAAAPDLLEALKNLLADIQDYQRINNLGGENNHWQVRSRAAIAKAEGKA